MVVVFLVVLVFFVGVLVFAWFGLVSPFCLCFFACLRSFTDWCTAHRQQSREQKESFGEFFERRESVLAMRRFRFRLVLWALRLYLFRVSLARRFVMSCSNKPELFEKDDGLIEKCHPHLLLQMCSAIACVAPP